MERTTTIKRYIYTTTFPIEKIPATYHKGKHPIDTILVSHSIQATKAGFTAFGELPTDHTLQRN